MSFKVLLSFYYYTRFVPVHLMSLMKSHRMCFVRRSIVERVSIRISFRTYSFCSPCYRHFTITRALSTYITRICTIARLISSGKTCQLPRVNEPGPPFPFVPNLGSNHVCPCCISHCNNICGRDCCLVPLVGSKSCIAKSPCPFEPLSYMGTSKAGIRRQRGITMACLV